MLSFLITRKQKQNKIMKGHRRTPRGDGYVYYLDHGDGYLDVCIYPNS